jgi:hypothetical protein
MSDLIDLKRNLAQESINKNPTTLTITRVENVENANGGKTELTPTTYNAIVRITKVNNASIEANENIGIQNLYSSFILLADYNNDFSPDIDKYYDTFSYENITYKITSVMVNEEKGSITSKQVLCEVIQ